MPRGIRPAEGHSGGSGVDDELPLGRKIIQCVTTYAGLRFPGKEATCITQKTPWEMERWEDSPQRHLCSPGAPVLVPEREEREESERCSRGQPRRCCGVIHTGLLLSQT